MAGQTPKLSPLQIPAAQIPIAQIPTAQIPAAQINVAFVDLKRQMNSIKADIDKAISTVLDHGKFILGPEVAQFEKLFSSFVGTTHCIGVDNGTMALVLALRALEVGPNDAVLVPANTYIATALAVSTVGARLVLADPDPDTYNLSAETVERMLSHDPTISVVMPVHLYGQPCDIQEICEVARQHGAKIVEDACQAHGARYNGKQVGSFGDAAAFSFYPGKNLGAYGDGGAVTTNNDEVSARVRALRDYGQTTKYHHETKGGNHRLDTIQAAILLAKLPHLGEWNTRRAMHAVQYQKELKNESGIKLPAHAPGRDHVYHLFVIECDRRDELQTYLSQHGISTGVHYPIPIHHQNAYKELHALKGRLPVSEKAAGRILSLPMFAELTKDEIHYVCEKVKGFFIESSNSDKTSL